MCGGFRRHMLFILKPGPEHDCYITGTTGDLYLPQL